MTSTPQPISDGSSPSSGPAGPALGALMAVSRLLASTAEGGREEVQEAIVREARACFGARRVVLVEDAGARRVRVVAGDGPAGEERALDGHRPLSELLDRGVRLLRADGARATQLSGIVDGPPPGDALLLLLGGLRDGRDGVLLCADAALGAPTAAVDVEIATAFADAASAALGRLRAAEEHARQSARQRALTRAAKGLTESLDLETVLARICLEAATILDGDLATVYRRATGAGLTIAAAHGLPPEAVGYTLPPGAGLAGKVALHGRAMLTNDYPRIAGLPPDAPYPPHRRALAAPMHWDGELRGVLAVGFTGGREIDRDDLRLLETFAELAAAASANASAHAGLAHVARTDGLTGCLNHAALHDGLGREIQRAVRHESETLSLILFDLDDFKQINEDHGHLVGDEVLRRAGRALRHVTRPYDLAARYGGDEFALVAVGSDEDAACEIAARTLECVDQAIHELLPDRAGSAGTAGVAQWVPGINAVELVAQADRALLFAKQEGGRGRPMAFSRVADRFRPGRLAGKERGLPEPPVPEPSQRQWPRQRVDERLRKRTRQLAAANALGARLSAMTDVDEILEATVEELHRAFGFYCVALARLRDDHWIEGVAMRGAPFLRREDATWTQPIDAGLIGRCLRERRPVVANDVRAEPDYLPTDETVDVRAELVVPVRVGEALWGALNAEELERDAFDEDDVLLLQTVADQLGSAMRSAQLYEQIERAYLGTAEALAAALEAKDAYTAEHARSIVEQADAIGQVLGLDECELRDLRFAAIFHDIGKIAVPERILNKGGPLDEHERTEMQRHTVVGEQILAPVEFLAGVRELVRHEHERWDGRGYPDGLAGEAIPLGSRIILACDALHAMTSDRPYRRAMSLDRAVAELRRHAGSQFDPKVVDVLVELVGQPL